MESSLFSPVHITGRSIVVMRRLTSKHLIAATPPNLTEHAPGDMTATYLIHMHLRKVVLLACGRLNQWGLTIRLESRRRRALKADPELQPSALPSMSQFLS